MKRIALVLMLALTFPIAAATPASAAEYNGDRRLVIAVDTPCPSYYDPNFCGPVLSVRASFDDLGPSYREHGWASMKLTGPNGRVRFEYDTHGYLDTSGGSNYDDPDYWGPRVTGRAPTNLPAGEYTASVIVGSRGHWSCSVYFESGCVFFESSSTTREYKFTWDGTRQTDTPHTYTATATSTKTGDSLYHWHTAKATHTVKATYTAKGRAAVTRAGKTYRATRKVTAVRTFTVTRKARSATFERSATATASGSGTGWTMDEALQAAKVSADSAAERAATANANTLADRAALKDAQVRAKKKITKAVKVKAKKAAAKKLTPKVKKATKIKATKAAKKAALAKARKGAARR